MHLHVAVFYPGITLRECYALHLSEHYQTRVAKKANTARECVDYIPKGPGLTRLAKFSYQRNDISHADLLTRIKNKALRHEEATTYTGPEGGTWQIRGGVQLPFLSNCVHGAGTLRFDEVNGGVRRTVDGEITCRVLGLGASFEPAIIEETCKSLRAAAKYTPKYAAKHLPQAWHDAAPFLAALDVAEAAKLGAQIGA